MMSDTKKIFKEIREFRASTRHNFEVIIAAMGIFTAIIIISLLGDCVI